MKQETHWLLLQDEAPTIGCGWRHVTVDLGRKWVYIRCTENKSRMKRMTKRKWEHMVSTMLAYHKRNGASIRDTFTC